MNDIGSIGEDQFKLWCSHAGLTANVARRDIYGWDFLVQFPQTHRHMPLDGMPPPFMCMIQVKSTAVDEQRAEIKLDNWQRMITDPLPWFVVAISFQGENPIDTFIVHIDEKWTEKTLRRLREMSSADNNTPLHRTAMYVTWSAADRVASSGNDIKAAISNYIGNNMFNYAALKQSWHTSAGYAGNPRSMRVRMTGNTKDEVLRQFRDFALGIVDRLPIEVLSITDNRFGIPIDEFESSPLSDNDRLGHLCHLEDPSDGDLDIIFSNELGQIVISFKCRIYAAQSVFPFLPKKYWRYRIASPSVEVLLDHPRRKGAGRKANFTIHIEFPLFNDIEQPSTLGEMAKVGRVLRMMRDASKKGLRIALHRDGARIQWPLLGEDLSTQANVHQFTSKIEQLERVAVALGLDLNSPISPATMLRAANRIELMWRVVTAVDIPIGVPVPVPIEDQERAERTMVGRSVVVVLAVAIPVGDIHAVMAIGVRGVSTLRRLDDETCELQVEQRTSSELWREMMPTTGYSLNELERRLQQERSRLMENEGVSMVLVPSSSALREFTSVDLTVE